MESNEEEKKKERSRLQAQDVRFAQVRHLGELFEAYAARVSSEDDVETIASARHRLIVLVSEALDAATTQAEYKHIVYLFQHTLLPQLRYFNEIDRRSLADKLCVMTSDNNYKFGLLICGILFSNVDKDSLPILHILLMAHMDQIAKRDHRAHVDWAKRMTLTVHRVVDMCRTLVIPGKSTQAKELLQRCYEVASSGVLVFSAEFNVNKDDRLIYEIDILVTLLNMASGITVSLLHKHHGMRKIVRDHLMWWCSVHKIYEKIQLPTQLIRAWVQAHCNDLHKHRGFNRTIYKLMSSGQSFRNEALSILVGLEQTEYMIISTQYPEGSKECLRINHMIRVLQKTLTVKLLCTRQILWHCRRLLVEARTFRLQALQHEVAYMSKCHTNLSQAITILRLLYKKNYSKFQNEEKGDTQAELAKAYSMRALHTHETRPYSESIVKDIENAVKFWCLQDTCAMDLSLLYLVYDLLSLKGITHLHSRIYQKLLSSSSLEDVCITLWKSGRISHAVCGSPICCDFLTTLLKKDDLWSHVDVWTRNMDEIGKVALEHKLGIDINIKRMKQTAMDLLQTDASDHNMFVVGHLFNDLAKTQIERGAIIEGIHFAKKTFELCADLLKKMTFIVRNREETLKVRPEVATKDWPHDEGTDLKNNILTPWNIIKIYLEISLLCGDLEDNEEVARRYLLDGDKISRDHNLPTFKIRFANALAKHQSKKQSGYNRAKVYLKISAKELKVHDQLISCCKCKNILRGCMKREYGNIHIGRETSKGAIFYKECYKILTDRGWENSFSVPTQVGPTEGICCHSNGISGPNSIVYHDKCWHCQSIKVSRSGSVQIATYMQLEIMRRRLLMGLLARLGEHYRAEKAFVEEKAVIFERLSLFLGRSTLSNSGIDISEELIKKIINQRFTSFPFLRDCATLIYDVCCYYLRNHSEFICKEEMVCALKHWFTQSRQIPLLHQKISRLLSVLYYEDWISSGGSGLEDHRIGLAHHHWVAFLHQASIGTLFNNTICSQMKKDEGVDLLIEDYIEEDIHTSVLKCIPKLPGVPLIFLSLIGGAESDVYEKLLSDSPTKVWIQISRLCENEDPQVYIIPLTSSITDAPSLEPCYALSIIKGKHILDRVAPVYQSIMREREYVCQSGPETWNVWEPLLDKCIEDVLRNMEEKWFHNYGETFLADLIGRERDIILIPDLEIQCVAWESLPSLRFKEVYRMVSLVSVSSTLERSRHFIKDDCCLPVIDLRKTYFVLNPQRNLNNTERRLLPLFEMNNFKGVVKRYPSRQEFNEALVENEMFIFDGHDTALEHLTRKITKVDRCPAMLLTACSSGALELNGSYLPGGPVVQYIVAGAPAIVAYLWTAAVIDSDSMSNSMIRTWTGERGKRRMGLSVVEARGVCLLPYFEGAGVICYGVPTSFM